MSEKKGKTSTEGNFHCEEMSYFPLLQKIRSAEFFLKSLYIFFL